MDGGVAGGNRGDGFVATKGENGNPFHTRCGGIFHTGCVGDKIAGGVGEDIVFAEGESGNFPVEGVVNFQLADGFKIRGAGVLNLGGKFYRGK